jgi:hypothetical protein
MNERQKEWSRQYTSNIGAKEFLRLCCAIMAWVFVGVGISISLELAGYSGGSLIISVFIVAMFVFPFVAFSGRSTYTILRKILGNENVPKGPFPRFPTKIPREPRPWWSYLSGLWFTLMTLITFYFAFKHFLK